MVRLALALAMLAATGHAFGGGGGAPRCAPLRGATADFVAEAFRTDADESAAIEARVIAASPGPMAQLLRVATAPGSGADAEDVANLAARRAEVRGELIARCAALAGLGLSDAELRRVVLRVPEVLAYSGVAAAAASLKTRLGLDAATFKKKVVLRLPQALGLRYDADVAPELDALKAGLGLDESELRALVLCAPQVLGLKYDADVAPKVAALTEALGSTDAARAEALRRPAALDLEVRGSKRGGAPS